MSTSSFLWASLPTQRPWPGSPLMCTERAFSALSLSLVQFSLLIEYYSWYTHFSTSHLIVFAPCFPTDLSTHFLPKCGPGPGFQPLNTPPRTACITVASVTTCAVRPQLDLLVQPCPAWVVPPPCPFQPHMSTSGCLNFHHLCPLLFPLTCLRGEAQHPPKCQIRTESPLPRVFSESN